MPKSFQKLGVITRVAALLAASAAPACDPAEQTDLGGSDGELAADGGLSDKVSALQNVALGASTTQSSTSYGGNSSRAVDGETNGRWRDGSVTHTSNTQSPWWRVDLGGAHRVERVTIYNRTDCCSSRLSNFHVDYLDAQGNVIASRDHAGRASERTEITLAAGGVHAVRVQLYGANFLSLAEVQVWGSEGVGGGAQLCGEGAEGSEVRLACPSGAPITRIDFASYGTPDGSCDGGFEQSACHAQTSVPEVEMACLGKPSCSVRANNVAFGDPCPGTFKRLAVAYTCGGGSGGGGEAGVNFAHYALSSPSRMPDFDALTPDVQGRQANVELGRFDGTDEFGMVFWGFLNIEQAGEYTFQTVSDDGSMLYIDERLVVNNDGLHGARASNGRVSLSAGYHAFVLEFFENRGGEVLELNYRRGNDSFAPVPDSMLLAAVGDGGGGDNDDCPNDPSKTVPGICGCGTPDTDGDGDGAADCEDECPSDRTKTSAGECGCGMAEGSCGGDSEPQNLTLTATADAYVDSAASGSNFGRDSQLLVDNDPDVYHALLRFRVPSLTAALQRATLRIHVTNPTGNGPKVYRTSNDWTEGGVNWNNKPGPSGSAIADIANLSTGWLEVDVTDAITGGGDYSFLLMPDATDGADFDSRESGNKPQLIVVTGEDDGGTTGGDGITHVGTTEVWDGDGQNLTIARPSGSRPGDLLVLVLHRTDDVLPLNVRGWTRRAECFKHDNGYECFTEADCTDWYDGNICRRFNGDKLGRDLAQTVLTRRVGASEDSTYSFNLNRDNTGHPGWAILTALRGADTNNPVRDWSFKGCDGSSDSLFPSVFGEAGDMLLLSQSFDDRIAQSKFGPPSGTETFGYVSNSDEAGFLFGGVLSSRGETGTKRTQGEGGPGCKDGLVSLTIRPQ